MGAHYSERAAPSWLRYDRASSSSRRSRMRKVFLALFAGMVIGVLASAPGHSAAAVMGSTAVSWEEIQARPSGTGVTKAKQVFKDPTATLDELELHVSTLPPGQSPHPPHKHPDE